MDTPPSSPQPSSARAHRLSAGWQSFITLFLAAAILFMINYFSFEKYFHQDFSTSQIYTLSPKTKEVLRQLDSPVVITTLFSYAQQNDVVHQEMITRLLEEYKRYGQNNLIVDKIDPELDTARSKELVKRLQFDANANLIIIEYKKQVKFINQDDLFDSSPEGGSTSFKGEQTITANLVSLIEGKPAKVYFTEGHLERDIESSQLNGCSLMGDYLKRNSIDILKVNLTTSGDVPTDAEALVILGPSVSFSPLEAEAVARYLKRNGQLIILLDPYTTSGLESILSTYGIKYDNDLVLYRAMSATGYITVPYAIVTSKGVNPVQEVTQKLATRQIEFNFLNMRSLSILNDPKGAPNPKVTPLLTAYDKSFGSTKPLPTSGDVISHIKDIQADPKSDLLGPLYLALAYDSNALSEPDPTAKPTHGTRIIALGGSGFLTNEASNTLGGDFFSIALDWMVKKNPVLDINPKTPQEYPLTISPLQGWTLVAFALLVIPGIPLFVGLFTWISRLK